MRGSKGGCLAVLFFALCSEKSRLWALGFRLWALGSRLVAPGSWLLALGSRLLAWPLGSSAVTKKVRAELLPMQKRVTAFLNYRLLRADNSSRYLTTGPRAYSLAPKAQSAQPAAHFHFCSPSTMVIYRSTGTSVRRCTSPLGCGHRISTQSKRGRLPMPRTTRGSWEER